MKGPVVEEVGVLKIGQTWSYCPRGLWSAHLRMKVLSRWLKRPHFFCWKKMWGREDRSLREKRLKNIPHLEGVFFSFSGSYPNISLGGHCYWCRAWDPKYTYTLCNWHAFLKNPNKRSCQTPLVAIGKSKANHSERFGNHYRIEIWPFKNGWDVSCSWKEIPSEIPFMKINYLVVHGSW